MNQKRKAHVSRPAAMRRRAKLLVTLVLLVALAGCSARGTGGDPWAYTRKPLYSGHIQLDGLTPEGERQTIFVEDGSINRIRASVWVNTTQGGAIVEFVTPSGQTVWSTTSTGAQSLPMELGAWTLRVRPLTADTTGSVGVLVTR
jgi:hypothetical protein